MAATERDDALLLRTATNSKCRGVSVNAKREPSMMNHRKNLSLFNKSGVRITVLGSLMVLCAGTGLAQFGGANAQPNSSTPPGQEPGQTNPIANDAGPREPKTGSPETGVNLGAHGMADKMFLRKVAEGGMAVVQLGQLAATNAGSPAVKAFGTEMAASHTQLNDALQPIDKAMGVQPPTKLDKKSQAELNKLHGLSGAAFDKEYLAFMVKTHRSDDKDFTQEAISTENNDLKSIVLRGDQMIRAHLKVAEDLANNTGAGATASK